MEAAIQLRLPDSALIRANAEALVPKLREMSAEINAARYVPEEVMAMLADAGLMSLARPSLYGGPDMGLDLILDVCRILAKGDGSTAWVYAVTQSHDHLVGLYPKVVQDAYWASKQPLCASSYQPQGKPIRVEGGYRLSGQWSFCSGIDHCGWVVVGSLIFDEGAPAPRLGFFMIPKQDFKVVDDWFMMGLSGTGSKTVVVENLFVPDDQVLDNADIMAGNTQGKLIHDNPLYGASVWLLFGFSIVAPAPGIARGAYEWLVADSQAKVKSGDRMFAAKQTQVGMRLAEIGALIDSADLLFTHCLKETAALIAAGKPVSLESRARNRRNQTFIARTCREAMDHMMQLAGGRGLKEDAPIQRAMRDIYAISAHPGGNLDSAYNNFGSILLGGPPTELFA